MSDFLSRNATLLVAILALLVNIIVQWDAIKKRFSTIEGTLDSVPHILLKLLVISFSGVFVVSIFWIAIDYLANGKLSLNDILNNIANGAIWGIPLALISGILSRSTEGAIIYGALISIIILLIVGPIIISIQADFDQTKLNSIVLLLLIVNIGMTCGYVGFKTRSFIDNLTSKPAKD
jgi:hypothetical protein